MNNGDIDVVLGLDPGFTKQNPTAVAMVRLSDRHLLGRSLFVPDVELPWEERLPGLLAWLDEYIGMRREIEALAYEIPFSGPNQAVGIMLAHIGGVAQTLAWLHGLRCVKVRPAQAKLALAGKGNATKDDMIAAAAKVFGQNMTKDEADACGIALAAEGLL